MGPYLGSTVDVQSEGALDFETSGIASDALIRTLNFPAAGDEAKPRLYRGVVVSSRERPYNRGYVGRCSPATNSSAQSCAPDPVLRRWRAAGGAYRWRLVAL